MTKVPLYVCHIKRLWLYMFLAAMSISRSEEVTQLVQSKRTEAPASSISRCFIVSKNQCVLCNYQLQANMPRTIKLQYSDVF